MFDSVYRDCPIEINGITMTVDLIPLDLREFGVILEMYFLSKYYVTMDCHKKEDVLSKPDETEVVIFREDRKIFPTCIIYDVKAMKLLSKGYIAYLAHVMEVSAIKSRPEDISVVCEYLDFSQKNYLGCHLVEKLVYDRSDSRNDTYFSSSLQDGT